MIKICLLRHGRTPGNERRAYIGRTDEPLSDKGKEELLGHRGLYPAVEAVYSSPLRRCRETAELLYPNVPLYVEEAFREYDFGLFEGKTHEELMADALYREWIDANGNSPIPGGEDGEAFRVRCVKGFEKAVAQVFEKKFESVAILTHGGVIMSLMERLSLEKRGFYGWKVKNGQGFILSLEEEVWKERRGLSGVKEFPSLEDENKAYMK